MKYLKINLESFKIKGDVEDPEQLQADVYEKVQSLLESETLGFYVDEEDEDSDELDF